MKNRNVFATALFLFFLSLFLTRCTQDTSAVASSTETVLVKNPWSVDYYFHNQDMTNSYSSSRLLFSSTGAVGYQKDGEIIAGTWNRSVDASNNELIALQFNSSDVNMEGLSKTWKLINKTARSLEFVETDGTTNILFRLKTQ